MGRPPSDWAVPALTDVNRAWFTSGALAVQQCGSCSTLLHPPEEVCFECGGMQLDTTVLAAKGTVHSFTVVHYPANRALSDAVPYTVVLVSLDDAPHLRVVGNIDGPVHIGMAVVPYWEERTAEDGTVVLLPQWRAAES